MTKGFELGVNHLKVAAMVHKCAVSGCTNNSNSIIHYPLPEEPMRRQEWVEFLVKQSVTDISQTTRICGSHFSPDSFTKLDLGFTTRLILSIKAIPSIRGETLPANEVQKEVNSTESPSEASTGNNVSNAPSLACVKEEPQEEMSCDAMRVVKVEVHDESYDNSSSNQNAADGIMETNGTILKIEPCDEPPNVDVGKPFHCARCGEGFQDKAMLSQHERNKHSNTSLLSLSSRSYTCEDCGKVFAHRGFLRAHQKIHANMKSKMLFSCTKCDRKFPNNSSLKKHMDHHLRRLNYQCPVCKEDFELKGSLHLHIRNHQGERFKCKHCHRGFLRGDAYMKHIDMHTVVTPYYCDTCNVYMRTERGILQHQCPRASKDSGPVASEESRDEGGECGPLEEELQHSTGDEEVEMVHDSPL